MLALLVGIALPVACLTALTAVTTFRTVTGAIETAQKRTADSYAARTVVWYQGASRSLLETGTILAQSGDRPDCGRLGTSLLAQIEGYRAFYIQSHNGAACSASVESSVAGADLAAVAAQLKDKPAVRVRGGPDFAQVRYDHVTLGEKSYLAVYVRSDRQDNPVREGVLLVAPEALDHVFELGESDEGLSVALVSNGQIAASRGIDDTDTSWLPAQEIVPKAEQRWQAQSKADTARTYAARMVAPPDFYVIASFDDGPGRAARTQFLVLLLVPLLTMALLCVVYARAIDRHCVRWLRGIEAAARARSSQPSARALVADEMPSDIRSVAVAFNTMVDEQEVRQRRLRTALEDNRFLVRELHHRVKNSLQVVQSYIGLTKRNYRDEAKLALADAECRVHVLSAAYRFTLADGEMQPVRVDLFIEDVVSMISNLLRQRDQWITATIETRGSLPVDRIIPLGFLIVDVASRVLRSTPAVTIRVEVRDVDDQTIEVRLATDQDITHTAPPKLFAGLISQIEAIEVKAPAGRSLGAWRVAHGRV